MTGKSFLALLKAENPPSPPDGQFMLIGKERHDLGRPGNAGYPVRAIRTAYHACNATMPFRMTANIRSFPSLLKGRRPRRECTPVLYAIPAENSSKTKNLRPEAIFTTISARYFPCRTEYITQTAKCETKILCFRRL